MIYEKQVRTLLCGLREGILYTLRYYSISIQEEYDIWETGEDTPIRPPSRSIVRFYTMVYQYKRNMIYKKQVRTLLCGLRQDLLYASILWYINTRGIWYMRNRWGHSYAAFVKVYYTLRYYGISIQEEYDIWETGEDTSMRPPWRSIIRFDTMVYQYKRNMIYEKQVRTLLCGLRKGLLHASILWYINTRGIWYMRNRWGHSYAASVKVYYTLRYYGITLQEEYDIWETGEDTPMRPPWRSITRFDTMV